MPDYQTHYSFIIPLTPKQTDQVLKDLYEPEITKDIFEDGEFFYVCTEKTPEGLWVYSGGNESSNDAEALLKYLVDKYNLPPMGFSWVNGSTNIEPDSFHGGALWTNGKTTEYTTTSKWLQDRKEHGC